MDLFWALIELVDLGFDWLREVFREPALISALLLLILWELQAIKKKL